MKKLIILIAAIGFAASANAQRQGGKTSTNNVRNAGNVSASAAANSAAEQNNTLGTARGSIMGLIGGKTAADAETGTEASVVLAKLAAIDSNKSEKLKAFIPSLGLSFNERDDFGSIMFNVVQEAKAQGKTAELNQIFDQNIVNGLLDHNQDVVINTIKEINNCKS